MRLLFLVNGSPQSTAAIRALAFADRLPRDWKIRLGFRPAQKFWGIAQFLRLAVGFKPHVIYVMDVAYTGVLAGCIAKQLTRCRLLTDTGDAIYELLKSMGNHSSGQLRLAQWTEQLALQRSDSIVVRGSYHQAYLKEKGFKHVAFVPDGVDTTVEQPVDASRLREELKLEGMLVVGMMGSMRWSERHQMCYGWDVIEALAYLRGRDVKALLVGDGDGRPILEHRARDLGVEDRVVFVGQVPYSDLPRYLSAMDVCVSTQSNDLIGMVRTTGKLPLYLAYGKCVIATDVGEARRVLPEVGYLLPYHGVRDDCYPERLAECLQRLDSHRELMNVEALARSVAKSHFDYSMLADRIQGICASLAV